MPMDEVIARVVDASRSEVFKPLYGKNMLCCWAHIHGTNILGIANVGHLTGIIANAQPVIFVPEPNKTTQFIKICNQSNIPIIFLHNVTGFMVGAKTEAQGLIKAGAQLVNAVSNSKVTHLIYHLTKVPQSVLFVERVMEQRIMLCAGGRTSLDSCLAGRLDDVVLWDQIS